MRKFKFMYICVYLNFIHGKKWTRRTRIYNWQELDIYLLLKERPRVWELKIRKTLASPGDIFRQSLKFSSRAHTRVRDYFLAAERATFLRAAYCFPRAQKIVLTIFSRTHLPHAKFTLAMQIPFIPFAIHLYTCVYTRVYTHVCAPGGFPLLRSRSISSFKSRGR